MLPSWEQVPWHGRSKLILRTKNQEPRTKIKEPRTKIQDPRLKNKDQRSKNQDQRSKIQDPRLKNQEQRRKTKILELSWVIWFSVILTLYTKKSLSGLFGKGFFNLLQLQIQIYYSYVLCLCSIFYCLLLSTYSFLIPHSFLSGIYLKNYVEQLFQNWQSQW